jgi:uncharacterized protein
MLKDQRNFMLTYLEDRKMAESVASNLEYLIISTTDEKGNKALTDGMMKRQMPQQQITNYIDRRKISR